MPLNPLHKWDLEKTKRWVKSKKEYMKYRGNFRRKMRLNYLIPWISFQTRFSSLYPACMLCCLSSHLDSPRCSCKVHPITKINFLFQIPSSVSTCKCYLSDVCQLTQPAVNISDVVGVHGVVSLHPLNSLNLHMHWPRSLMYIHRVAR